MSEPPSDPAQDGADQDGAPQDGADRTGAGQATPVTRYSPRDRLFRGYGPLVAFAAAFLAIALLVPSQPREVTVSAVDDSNAVTGLDDMILDDDDAADAEVLAAQEEAQAAADAAAKAASDSTGTDASDGATTSKGSGGTSATAGANGGGGAASGPTKVGLCGDREQQIPGDPYSPPCIAFSGTNGGATAPGVSDTSIRVAVRIEGLSNGMLDALSKVANAKIPNESAAVIARTIEGLTEYINRTFQMYGRTLEIVIYNGKGDVLKEMTGGGQEAAEADAIKVSQEIKAFADVSAVSPVYADSLARRQIVNFGAPFMSREWLSQRRPYVWSQLTDCSTVVESVSSYYVVKMANKPAALAGGNLKGQPRRLGIIAPENSWYQECVAAGKRIAASAGVTPALDEQYRLDINQMSVQAGEKLAKLKNAGITTVLCGCDPLFLTFLTAKAKEQDYHPEWLSSGVALIDNDLIGSIMEQGEWGRAFGVSFSGATEAAGQGRGYRAYKAVRPDEPSIGVELIYNQLYMLAIGVQMAGPQLTPATFEQGMFRYPTRSGPSGRWGFGPNDYSTSDDAHEIYWDPRATSVQTREPGAYVDPNGGRRFPIGRWPTTAPRASG